jgi:hypothetical protein
MYKTPKLKSEMYDIPNTIGEKNKAKADPSLPRKPDFPEIDVSELTETTLDKLSSRETAQADILNKISSRKRNINATYPPPIVHDSEVIVYGLGGLPDQFEIISETNPTTVTRTVYGGHRQTFDTWDPIHDVYLRLAWTPVHTYYLYAGSAESEDRHKVTDYYVTDSSLIDSVDLELGDQSSEILIAYDYDRVEREYGELILPFQQSYTDYTKVISYSIGRDSGLMIETVVGGRQTKRIEYLGGLYTHFYSTSEDAPDTNMSRPGEFPDDGNYTIATELLEEHISDDVYHYNLVIRNYSVYPRLIRMRTI